MQTEIKKLDAQIAELTAKRDALLKGGKRWRAEKRDRYYFISNLGNVAANHDDHYMCDDDKYRLGNYFRTQDEAEYALKRLIATQQLKDRIAELNSVNSWEYAAATPRFTFHYDETTGLLEVVDVTTFTPQPREFIGSREAIETVKKEMLEQIEMWLGV